MASLSPLARLAPSRAFSAAVGASQSAGRRLASTKAPRTLPEFSMEGKVCVVTGAARGLGNEFCRAFVNSGCTKLALVDLKQSEADEAARELVETTCANSDLTPDELKIIGIECDVSSETSVQQAFQVVQSQFGRVDSVVASAGIVHNYAAVDYPTERMKQLYDINVHGAFFTAREAAKLMLAQEPTSGAPSRSRGAITLVASMSASIVNIPQAQTPYNASKAAVRHMAASLAVEWAKQGVRVNALSPGYMLTKLTRTILQGDVELKKTWEGLTPMGRMGEPEDLAGAIVFLSSDASRFVTGTELRVDGGYCVV